PVDVADARLDLPGELNALGDVASEERSRQAVLGIVRKLHGLLRRLHTRDRHLGPEGLLAEQRHVGSDLVDHDALHDGAVTLAAPEHLGALGAGFLYELQNTIDSRLADHASQYEIPLARISARERGNALRELRCKLIRHFLVDDDTLGRHADLTGIRES